MYGYEIIKYLEDKSHGMWSLSPGSVFPTFKILVEQGLVETEGIAGKNINKLTSAGKKEAEASTHSAPWEKSEIGDLRPERIMELRHFERPLMQNIKHIMRYGSEQHYQAAQQALEEVVEKLTKIAGSDDSSSTTSPWS